MISATDILQTIECYYIETTARNIKNDIQNLREFHKFPKIPNVIHLDKKYTDFNVRVVGNASDTIILTSDKTPNICLIDIKASYFSPHELMVFLGLPTISSFQITGHILHLNLDERHMKHKKIIGELLLSFNKNVRTVITKINSVSGDFRTFEYEIIAGQKNLGTLHSENGIKFYVDYDKVYWNSKLSGERQKLVSKYFLRGQTVADCTCGAGPLALLALKHEHFVYANDLNENATNCILKTLKINKKLQSSKIEIFNLTSDDFIAKITKSHKIDHFVFNLPEKSLDLLPVLKAYNSEFSIHCYFFCSDKLPVLDFVRSKIWFPVELQDIVFIRKSSPSKTMYRLSKFIPQITQ